MTEARRIDCPGLMQNNPFPLRVAPRYSLRLNATQPGSSYGRLPFAMSRTHIQPKLVSAFLDCNRFQKITPELNSIRPLPPPRSP